MERVSCQLRLKLLSIRTFRAAVSGSSSLVWESVEFRFSCRCYTRWGWAFTSLQYTSMNTLVYADITEKDTSAASSIASTMQQMSISFGVAAAGLATAVFVPSTQTDPAGMIRGIHEALIALGILTIVSTVVFLGLKSGDGDDVSQHKVLQPVAVSS